MAHKASITDALREGFEVTKKNANSVLVMFVALQVIIFILTDLMGMPFLNILMIPVVLFMQMALYKSFKSTYTKFDVNHILSLKDAHLKPTLWKLFITNLIYVILLVLLFLLLVIPGIIFMVYWYVFSVVVMDQGLSGMEALKKSREMIRGNWWRTFGLVLISALIMGVISSIVSSITGGSSFAGGLLMAIISAAMSVYFGYVAIAYYFGLRR